MNVTYPELLVVGSSVALFALAPALLDLLGSRRSGASDPSEVKDPTDPPDPPDPSDIVAPADLPDFADLADPPDFPQREWLVAVPANGFSLGELRDAGALVAGAGDAAERATVAAARRVLEATELSAPCAPLAYAIAGVESAGSRRRIVALLFEQMWPEGAQSAVARAVFELGDDGTIVAATVEPV